MNYSLPPETPEDFREHRKDVKRSVWLFMACVILFVSLGVYTIISEQNTRDIVDHRTPCATAPDSHACHHDSNARVRAFNREQACRIVVKAVPDAPIGQECRAFLQARRQKRLGSDANKQRLGASPGGVTDQGRAITPGGQPATATTPPPASTPPPQTPAPHSPNPPTQAQPPPHPKPPPPAPTPQPPQGNQVCVTSVCVPTPVPVPPVVPCVKGVLCG